MSVLSLRPLKEHDAPTVQAWLRADLTEHLAWWQGVYAASPESDLAELVRRDWQELMEADPERQWVRVAGAAQPQGMVFAGTRRDRYMGFEVGVLLWIYVDAAGRGQGVRGREVFVTAQKMAAVQLYERHGYRVFDHRMLGGE